MKNKNVYLVILVAFLCKCFIAGIVELNNDEVYYWTYARKLQWSYFDHPPFLAILLKFFTANLLFENELMLRLGPVVCGTINTWLIYLIGKKLRNEQTGIIAALLFLASPYANVIAGLLVIPDAPQLVFWLWSVLLMLEITQRQQAARNTNLKILLLGVTIGLCILSKVHGIFLWAGFIVYAALFQRAIFKNRYVYIALFITICLLLPILFWNVSNDFITYRYQGNRVSFFGAIQWNGFFRELSGEIAYNNLVNFFIILITFWAIVAKKQFVEPQLQRLLLSVSLPLIFFVLFLALFRDTLPHWTGPAYTTLIPLAAAYINSRQKDLLKKTVPRVVHWALGLTIVLLIAAICLVKWLPVSIGSEEWQRLGKHDVTLDMNGWKQFGIEFDSLYRQDLKTGTMSDTSFLIADYWFPAAHIDYYVARKYGLHFLAIGDLPAIHHYAWLNPTLPFLKKGNDAYFITVSNFYNPPSEKLVSQFAKLSDTATITQYRSGIPVRNFFIYRLKNYQGNIPSSGVQR